MCERYTALTLTQPDTQPKQTIEAQRKKVSAGNGRDNQLGISGMWRRGTVTSVKECAPHTDVTQDGPDKQVAQSRPESRAGMLQLEPLQDGAISPIGKTCRVRLNSEGKQQTRETPSTTAAPITRHLDL
ncbi:hypothetical protein JZ751_016144 [Albula glossodonta]|uniref:Uncharacterized protein n=1 Tax=Albula glossodonta TaxID=121402 RepID=A0A8T2N2K5_9TELE|nr:hypothetical protein JZ751_016144 [Albula glossodonta]